MEDFDRQGADICETVVTHSRFSQAALLLENGGPLPAGWVRGPRHRHRQASRRTGCAHSRRGHSWPRARRRLQSSTARPCSSISRHGCLPGDDLERLRFTSVLAVPMMGRTGADGALLLKACAPKTASRSAVASDEPRADDLLPIEMLAARVQATRSQTMLFEKLIDSEKFAGLGQLAGNVTQQLNNPLTVILGYASLLEETAALNQQDRKARSVDPDRSAAHSLHA